MNLVAMQQNFEWKKVGAILIFLSGFALYLYSSAPALAPYRDMGEMVSVSHTLGIAHPPGYPTYTLLGKISTLIPFANQSYRVNLVSVLAGALSAVLLYLLLLELEISTGVAILAALLWIAASGVWIVSIVTEMYSLNLAAALFLGYLWFFYQKNGLQMPAIWLIAFTAGILCGVRLELVLIMSGFAAAIFYLLWRDKKLYSVFKISAIASLFFFLGFSIYLFLMIRSMQKPLLNWNRPETVEKLWSSLTRKTHGGTLDLLSTNYAPGELFLPDFIIYLKDASRQFFAAGAPLVFIGLYSLFKKNRADLILTFVAWLFTGAFFIYKANMPPNPHALAVLEAHFLLPNVFVIIWIALGLEYVREKMDPRYRVFLVVLLILLSLVKLFPRYQKVSKRNNWFGYDYTRNIFRTVPNSSILIMQKDVQLFSFWASQYAEQKRKDLTVISRGLAGSPWYIKMREEGGVGVKLGSLRSESDFERFLTENPDKRVFIGWEEDVPLSSKYKQVPYGLVREIIPVGSSLPIRQSQGRQKRDRAGFAEEKELSPDFLRTFYVYRGNYHYPAQKEFFSSDIIDDYSKAHFARGVEYSKSNLTVPHARREWNRSVALNSENASAYYRRAFTFFQNNQMPLAVRDFAWAEKLYEKTYQLTQQYYSLPDVVKGVQTEWADCLVNLGVGFERLGQKDKSEEVYLRALKVEPNFPNAHYNLAVLYWNRDWQKVVNHLQATLRIDPNNVQARSFLPKALYALEMSQKKPQ